MRGTWFEQPDLDADAFTRVSNVLIDFIFPLLPQDDVSAFTYALRRHLGYREERDAGGVRIQLKEFVEGRRTRSDEPIDLGSGLSRSQVYVSIKRLREANMLVPIARRKSGRPGLDNDDDGSVWAVNTRIADGKWTLAPFFPFMSYGQLGRYVLAARALKVPPPVNEDEASLLVECIAQKAKGTSKPIDIPEEWEAPARSRNKTARKKTAERAPDKLSEYETISDETRNRPNLGQFQGRNRPYLRQYREVNRPRYGQLNVNSASDDGANREPLETSNNKETYRYKETITTPPDPPTPPGAPADAGGDKGKVGAIKRGKGTNASQEHTPLKDTESTPERGTDHEGGAKGTRRKAPAAQKAPKPARTTRAVQPSYDGREPKDWVDTMVRLVYLDHGRNYPLTFSQDMRYIHDLRANYPVEVVAQYMVDCKRQPYYADREVALRYVAMNIGAWRGLKQAMRDWERDQQRAGIATQRGNGKAEGEVRDEQQGPQGQQGRRTDSAGEKGRVEANLRSGGERYGFHNRYAGLSAEERREAVAALQRRFDASM